MSEMIEISKLKEHPRNKEFFDDITGDRWNDFKESVVRRGIVEPIVTTQDLLVVSGHQRVRACKEIGLLDIPCRITYYPEYDEKFNRTKEDMILEDLICTNIMQRGVGNVNPMKMAKCIMELERIYGVQKGNNQYDSLLNNSTSITQTDIANQLDIDRTQLINYKKLTNLIPELQQMVENGSMKATVGYKIWAKMPQDEQEKFFEEIGREKIKTMTQKATEQYIEENNKLKEQLEKEKNKPREKEYIETVVDNTDYSIANRIKKVEEELQSKTSEADKLKTKLELMTNKADAYEKDSLSYNKMKEEIMYLTQQKDDLGRKIQAITDISGLVVEVDNLIKQKLAPIRYSKSLLEAKDDKIVLKNLNDIVETVQQWCDEIKEYLPNKINYVEVIE